MAKLENLSATDVYESLFKACNGVWSMGVVVGGERRLKVDVQNQDVGNNPTFNVIVGDLSMNDLLLLTKFLSSNLACDIPIIDDGVEAEVDPELVYFANTLPADVMASPPIDTSENMEEDDSILDDVFKDSNEEEDIVEENPAEIDPDDLEDEDVGERFMTATDISDVLAIFDEAGYVFEDEEEVIAELKKAQKELSPPVLKGRRTNGLRSEWGKYWRDKKKGN